jgi:prophage antirepressor-like protein
MQSLVNSATFVFGDKHIRTMSVDGNPWLCGKDIATVLGYVNPTKAISVHADIEDRATCDSLVQGCAQIGHTLISYNSNDLKTIYVNESGTYALIMRSKLALAKQFQKWVTSEVLPSIRRNGYYVDPSIQDEKIQQLQHELAIRDEEARAMRNEHLRQQQESKEHIEKLERKQLALTSFVNNNKPIEKNQIFYIATTDAYARQNRFEYGGVSKAKDLRSRLSTYNTGRAENDLMRYVKIIKCTNYRDLETRIATVLQKFKDKQNGQKEMLHIRYNMLVEIIEYIANNYDGEIDFINERYSQYIDGTVELDPIIPPPVSLDEYLPNTLEVTVRNNGRVARTEVIDVSTWSDEKINEVFTSVIDTCCQERKSADDGSSTDVDDGSVNDDSSVDEPIVLTWSTITAQLRKEFRSVKRMDTWRELFRHWSRSMSIPTNIKIMNIAY